MRAIDKTTELFVASIKVALPNARVDVQKSRAKHGRSNYVYFMLIRLTHTNAEDY